MKDRLRALRKESGLTQEQLAEHLQMSKGTIAMWEQGTRKPSYQVLGRLSLVYDRKISYILGESDDETGPAFWEEDWDDVMKFMDESALREVIMKYLRLDRRGRAAAEALIDTEFRSSMAEGTLLPSDIFGLELSIHKPEQGK